VCIGTYSLVPESPRVIPSKFDSVSSRNATRLVACINLLGYKRLRRSNENGLALREPSVDYEQRLIRVGRQ
jgi:hypothetical protein